MEDGIIIDYIGGLCPVQAEGTIDGAPFYFRARWEDWSIGIGEDPVGISAWQDHGFYMEEEYDSDADDVPNAGYMPEFRAEEFIRLAAEKYRATR